MVPLRFIKVRLMWSFSCPVKEALELGAKAISFLSLAWDYTVGFSMLISIESSLS